MADELTVYYPEVGVTPSIKESDTVAVGILDLYRHACGVYDCLSAMNPCGVIYNSLCNCKRLPDDADSLRRQVTAYCKHRFIPFSREDYKAWYDQSVYANGFSYSVCMPLPQKPGTVPYFGVKQSMLDFVPYCNLANDRTFTKVPPPFCDHMIDVMFPSRDLVPRCLQLQYVYDNMLVCQEKEDGYEFRVDKDIFSKARFFEDASFLAIPVIQEILDTFCRYYDNPDDNGLCMQHCDLKDEHVYCRFDEESKFLGKCTFCEKWCIHCTLYHRVNIEYLPCIDEIRSLNIENQEDWFDDHVDDIRDNIKIKYLCFECDRKLFFDMVLPGCVYLCEETVSHLRFNEERPFPCLVAVFRPGIKVKSSMKSGLLDKRTGSCCESEQVKKCKRNSV